MTEDLSREEVVAAMDRAVEELLAAAGVTAPPVDAIAIAQRHLGWTIRYDGRPRRRPARSGARNEIVLSSGQSVEQSQLAVARAIGAWLKPDVLRALGVPAEHKALGLSPAELFAKRLLLPTAWFAAEARDLDYDVLELQRRFSTAGHVNVAKRLLDLPEPCVITIVDNDRVVHRRSNTWRTPRQLSPAENECQRDVSGQERPCRVRSGGWTVQGWPVPWSTGKREILRSVLDDEAAGPELFATEDADDRKGRAK